MKAVRGQSGDAIRQVGGQRGAAPGGRSLVEQRYGAVPLSPVQRTEPGRLDAGPVKDSWLDPDPGVEDFVWGQVRASSDVRAAGGSTRSAGAYVVLSSTALTFEPVKVGQASALQTVTLSNKGGSVKIDDVAAVPRSDSFRVYGIQQGQVVRTGGKVVFQVEFRPTAGGKTEERLHVLAGSGRSVGWLDVAGVGLAASKPADGKKRPSSTKKAPAAKKKPARAPSSQRKAPKPAPQTIATEDVEKMVVGRRKIVFPDLVVGGLSEVEPLPIFNIGERPLSVDVRYADGDTKGHYTFIMRRNQHWVRPGQANFIVRLQFAPRTLGRHRSELIFNDTHRVELIGRGRKKGFKKADAEKAQKESDARDKKRREGQRAKKRKNDEKLEKGSYRGTNRALHRIRKIYIRIEDEQREGLTLLKQHLETKSPESFTTKLIREAAGVAMAGAIGMIASYLTKRAFDYTKGSLKMKSLGTLKKKKRKQSSADQKLMIAALADGVKDAQKAAMKLAVAGAAAGESSSVESFIELQKMSLKASGIARDEQLDGPLGEAFSDAGKPGILASQAYYQGAKAAAALAKQRQYLSAFAAWCNALAGAPSGAPPRKPTSAHRGRSKNERASKYRSPSSSDPTNWSRGKLEVHLSFSSPSAAPRVTGARLRGVSSKAKKHVLKTFSATQIAALGCVVRLRIRTHKGTHFYVERFPSGVVLMPSGGLNPGQAVHFLAARQSSTKGGNVADPRYRRVRVADRRQAKRAAKALCASIGKKMLGSIKL